MYYVVSSVAMSRQTPSRVLATPPGSPRDTGDGDGDARSGYDRSTQSGIDEDDDDLADPTIDPLSNPGKFATILLRPIMNTLSNASMRCISTLHLPKNVNTMNSV